MTSCEVCEQIIEKEHEFESSVRCLMCKKVYHPRCVGLTKAFLKTLAPCKNFSWFCNRYDEAKDFYMSVLNRQSRKEVQPDHICTFSSQLLSPESVESEKTHFEPGPRGAVRFFTNVNFSCFAFLPTCGATERQNILLVRQPFSLAFQRQVILQNWLIRLKVMLF